MMSWNKNKYGKDEHEINITPERYIDQALTKAIDALSSEDPKTGLIKYVQFVDVAEKIANASRKLNEDYHETIKQTREEVKKIESDELKVLKRIADKKVELIIASVLDSKPLFEELEL